MKARHVLTLACTDRPGIVSAVSSVLLESDANILEAAQFGDPGTQRFFMRVRFEAPGARLERLRRLFSALADRMAMQWAMHDADRRIPVVIMASQWAHCLEDLLRRQAAGLLPIDVRAILCNHDTHAALAGFHRVPYRHIPTPDAGGKQAMEAALRTLIGEHAIELVVLARYMQILSPAVCAAHPGRIINIHHSFLPSFKGARPYHQAQQRGVKIIGATAHYVTSDLDEGPIIEQDVVRVSHAQTSEELAILGRDVESLVLARAVKWHAEHRVMLNGHRTVIFH